MDNEIWFARMCDSRPHSHVTERCFIDPPTARAGYQTLTRTSERSANKKLDIGTCKKESYQIQT